MRCYYQGNMGCFLRNYYYLYNHQIQCIIFTHSKQERDSFVLVCMHNTFLCPGAPCRKWIGTSLKSQSSCLLVFLRVRHENKPGCELIGYSFYYNIPLLLIDNSCVASYATPTAGMKQLQVNWMYRILKRGRYYRERKITSLSAPTKRVIFLLSCLQYQCLFLCNACTGIFTFNSLYYILHIGAFRDKLFVDPRAKCSNRPWIKQTKFCGQGCVCMYICVHMLNIF